MSDINNIVASGRLTKDAVMRTLPTGTELCNFSIANNTGFGEYAKVNYFEVQLWGKPGKALCQYLLKGKAVAVVGSLEVQRWVGKEDKVEHSKNVINSTNITLLGGGKKDDSQPAEAEVADDVRWDIPC